MPDTIPKPKKATQAEADGSDGIAFEYEGIKLTLPVSLDEAPIELLEAFEDGKAIRAMRTLLGDEQWAKVKKVCPKVKDLKDFSDQVAAAMGFADTGE